MAKRKRLSPARFDEEDIPNALSVSRIRPAGSAPIAAVAGDASATAALQDLAAEMRNARQGGRLVIALPLDTIVADYLVRDRMLAEEDELDALVQSLRRRGQQTPIEVVALDNERFGLISGWRRLKALQHLAVEEGPESQFAHVLAILRQPEAASDAYLAMVEENEIRVGLSYYERGRIVGLSVQQGVFEDSQQALVGLFPTASRAKRSKIGSFFRIFRVLDTSLRFPSAIPERLGLSLAGLIDADPSAAAKLCRKLKSAAPTSPEEERAVIEDTLRKPEVPTPTRGTEIAPGILLKAGRNRVVIEGPAVTSDFRETLKTWLKSKK